MSDYRWPTEDEYETQQQGIKEERERNAPKTLAQLEQEMGEAEGDVADAEVALTVARECNAGDDVLQALLEEIDAARAHLEEVSDELGDAENFDTMMDCRFW